MAKVIECAKVDPSSGCMHVVRGKDESELMKNVAEHAKQRHGLAQMTPEVEAKLREAMHEE